jgi:two-component system, NarL family, response regulator YdfI
MVRVGLCASHGIARAGLLSLLQSTELDIVADTEGLAGIHTLLEWPTIDVLCLELPELERTTLHQLQDLLEPNAPAGEHFEQPSCVVITAPILPEPISITTIITTGVRGLLPHTVMVEELESAITAVAQGLIVLHPVFSDRLLVDFFPPISPSEEIPSLSDRELQVLDALAIGLSNKQIAAQLYISEHTVKFHISSILTKLQVSSRTEAVTKGIRQGLLKL